ncbi:MAG: helix-turn-helix domain-containing protein [Solirubrobacteraceae bacterium]
MSKLPTPSRFEILASRLCSAVAPLLVERVAELVAERWGERPPLLDAEAAARYLAVDVATVRRWARDRVIPSHPFGEGPRQRLRFDAAELHEASFRPAKVTGKDAIASDVGNGASDSNGTVMVNGDPPTRTTKGARS